MCGLVGAFRADGRKFHHKIEGFLTQGLLVSSLRGMGGTGVGIVGDDYEASHVKSQVDSGNFIFTDKYEWVSKNAHDARVLMGHTRAPTGATTISVKNSHPFHYYDVNNPLKSILLTHNGHVNNASSFTPNNFFHQVDSAHVAMAFLLKGADEILPKLNGFYVFIWYDQIKKTMNIARNDHRELYYAYDTAHETVFYASEKAILRFLLDRTGIAYDPRTNDGGAFQEIEPYEKWSWDLSKKSLDDPERTTYAKKQTPTTYTTHTGSGGYHGVQNKTSEPQITWGGNHPKVGDTIYVCVDKTTDFHLYNGNTSGTFNDWGYIHGIRKMDNADCVITGVKQKDWIAKYSLDKDAIPVTVKTISSVEDPKTKEKLIEYRGIINETVWNRQHPPVTALPNPKSTSNTGGNDGGGSAGVVSETPPAEGVGGLKKSPEQSETKEEGTEGAKTPEKSGEVATLEMVAGPNGKLISKEEWWQIAKQGCMTCLGQIISIDIGNVEWFPWSRNPEDPPEDTEYSMICPVCIRNGKHAAAVGA